MGHGFALLRWMVVGFFVVASSVARADGENRERVLAPHFELPSAGDVDSLPLKDTRADINIAGVVAQVRISQTWQNRGRRPIDAVYVFPGSTRAAMTGMQMTIGERTIVAKIEKRDVARELYEKARQRGQGASLLEQHRPNVFQMSVANIMPGEEILVEVSYTELIVPTEGIYEVVYPAVVGPRYSNLRERNAPPSERWVENPYWPKGSVVPYSFDVGVHIDAGMPLAELASPSHRIGTHWTGTGSADVVLDAVEKEAGNRDFVLRYRLGGSEVQAGMLLYPGSDENFFLLTVQPPARSDSMTIVPREYIFLLDVSGSMSGFPLDTAKELLRRLVTGLRDEDRFNVLLFSGGSRLWSPTSMPASEENLRAAIQVIEHERGGGGTELVPALEQAMALPGSDEHARSVVLLTDGFVGADQAAIQVVSRSLGKANLFAFGIGSSVNRHLIESLARAGKAEPFVVLDPSEAAPAADRFLRYVSAPVLTHVEVSFHGFEVFDLDPPKLPDVYVERPIILFGKYDGNAKGTVGVSGRSGNGTFHQRLDVAAFVPDPRNEALRTLWARQRVTSLSDVEALGHDQKIAEEITELGLEYRLITAYTSFLAVDSIVRNAGGVSVPVTQPLPLPSGVENSAIGRKANIFGAHGLGTGINNALGGTNGTSAGAGGLGIGGLGRGTGVGGYGPVDLGGRGKGRTRLVPGNVAVEGALSKEAIGRIMRRYLSQVRYCYERRLVADPSLAGRTVWELTIDGNGRVTSVNLLETSLNDPETEQCISSILGRIRFPAPKGGGIVQVRYPIAFRQAQP